MSRKALPWNCNDLTDRRPSTEKQPGIWRPVRPQPPPRPAQAARRAPPSLPRGPEPTCGRFPGAWCPALQLFQHGPGGGSSSPSGGRGAGSAPGTATGRPPARAAAAAAALLVFGGNRGDPRKPRADWTKPCHVTSRLGKSSSGSILARSVASILTRGSSIDIPEEGRASSRSPVIGGEKVACDWR